MIQTLTTRAQTLAALETLAASAQAELIIACRCFAPDTPLRTERLRELGLDTWADLIPWLTRRGVRLFMTFGDVDPLLSSAQHRRAWLAVSGFANVAQGDAQILCAPHGQQAGWLWRLRLRRPLRHAMRRLRLDEARRLTLPQRAALASGGSAIVRPQRVDHSFAIADGARAVIGGFALDAADWGPEWQDIAVQIEDTDFAGALRAHFADCWSDAIAAGAPPLASATRVFQSVTRRQSRPELRLLRTRSVPSYGPTRLMAEPRDNSFAARLCQHLAEARHSIYIETASLRHPAYVAALLDAGAASPELQVILILHPRQDNLPFDGALADTAEHARTLEAAQLSRLKRVFQSRLAVLVHEWPDTGTPDVSTGEVPDPLLGRVVIIDQTYAVLGSHDLTSRAAMLDTHASVLIHDAALASDLLQRRAAIWLGQNADQINLAQHWNAAGAPLTNWQLQPSGRGPVTLVKFPDALF